MRSLFALQSACTLVLASVLFLPGQAGAQVVDAAAPIALQQVARAHHICAMAVAWLKRGRVQAVQAAPGCDGAAELDPGTVFQAASLGKPLFAYAVLKLAQQGRLNLDAPLADHLPQGYVHQRNPFVDAPGTGARGLLAAAEWKQVTARQVLSHTSGLPNWSRSEPAFAFSPGSAWRYSGEGYVMLQRVVEAITGQGLEPWMRSQVFEPLGMQHSSYVWAAPLQARLAAGANAAGLPVAEFRFSQAVAAATLYTTAGDYARFVAALLADEAALRQTLDAPALADKARGLHWGLGWGIEAAGASAHLWHWGNNTGYRAFVMASVQTGDGVVMLSNSERGLHAVPALLAQALPGEHAALASPMLGLAQGGFWCRVFGFCG